MKAKLTIDGKDFEVEISEEQLQALTETKTGYERVRPGEIYYTGTVDGTSDCYKENNEKFDDRIYEDANYHSDATIAKNNARADKLYRQLRRFAVEHRKEEIDWNNYNTTKYFIALHNGRVEVAEAYYWCVFAGIYYDTKETVQLAIDTFKDELLWYFTEYKDSL